MNKFLYWSAASLSAIALASCAQDDIQPVNPDGLTTIEISLPADLATRYGEGKSASKLYVAVYPKDGSDVLLTNLNGPTPGMTVNDFAAGSLKTTVSIQLTKNAEYDLIFWAESGDAKTGPYLFSPENKTITVNYAEMANFAETRDAFYAHLDGFKAVGQTANVTLNRPFAQINIGTDDLAPYLRAAGANMTSQNFGMTVSGIANVLNLGDDTVTSTTDFSGQATVVPFSISNTNTLDAFPAVDYTGTLQYLDMGYFLVGDLGTKKSNLEINLTVGDNNAFSTYSNVPAQMNFRTNIYGSLLTNKENFNISIDPIFGNPDNNEEWMGDAKIPVIDEATKTVAINSPAELAGLSYLVNNGNTFEGYTVNLEADLNLAGANWTPIGYLEKGNTGNQGTGRFAGTFNGNNHTISNLTTSSTGDWASAGLFGRLNGVVKDLTLTNVNITSDHYAGAIAGYTYINTWYADAPKAAIQNCKVIGGTITSNTTLNGNEYDNGDKVGGITGYACDGNIVIADNTVSDLSINGYRHLASIVGLIDNNGPHNTGNVAISCTNNNANNVTITQNLIHNYKNLKPGELVAELYNTAKPATYTGTATNVKILWSLSEGLTQDANTFNVSTPAGLLAANTALSDAKVYNAVVNILADLDMNGATWNEVPWMAETNKLSVWNGNGHTIKNMKIVGRGLFANNTVATTTFRDTNFDNITVTAGNDINVGLLMGLIYSDVNVINVNITNSSLSGNYKVGGFLGVIFDEKASSTTTANLTNCNISNTTITATKHAFMACGMIAWVNTGDAEKAEFSGCSVNDITLVGPKGTYDCLAAIYATDGDDPVNEAPGVTVNGVTREYK